MEQVQIRSVLVERVLKSFAFSVALFVVWGWVAYRKAKGLVSHFDAVELAWCVYNAAISVLFLVRTRPSVVSTDPVHWVVALITSFSGYFFQTYSSRQDSALTRTANGLIGAGLLLGIFTAVSLGRSYDFLPALRGVQTGWAYSAVRHPMYLSSIVIRLGYFFRHASPYNLAVFIIVLWLYALRCRFEETVMARDSRYSAYMREVPWRLVPGLY
jgi:protein-S-isoprenylcysteine O-methyltransferase Ste14